jgi:NADH:ubiquinone oxidoreductase subunit 6 (subunit J)
MVEIYIYFLTSILIFFCVSTNTMYAVFSFIAYAILLFVSFFFFRIEFLTYLFLIIYMGAIIVLFLFVIMLIEFRPLKIDEWKEGIIKIIFLFFCWYSFFLSIRNLNLNNNINIITQTVTYPSNYDINYLKDYLDIIEIGLIIYDCYLVLFINITMLFLLGIISVVLLTKQEKTQFTYKKFRITNE